MISAITNMVSDMTKCECATFSVESRYRVDGKYHWMEKVSSRDTLLDFVIEDQRIEGACAEFVAAAENYDVQGMLAILGRGGDAFDTVAAIADDVIRELVNREVAGICDGDD